MQWRVTSNGKRFKRKFDKTGGMRQLRSRKQFVKPSIKNRDKNRISTIPEGKRAVIGSPVVTDAQADEILSSELITCRKYKFIGNPLLFYVFLKQLEALEQDVFILDTSITKSKSNNDDSPQIVFTMMLVY